jgi:hypothetical protein
MRIWRVLEVQLIAIRALELDGEDWWGYGDFLPQMDPLYDYR